MPNSLVSLNINFGIGYQSTLASVVDREIRLEPGVHFLFAKNGKGKTTLLKTLAGLLKQRGGDYELHGQCCFLGEDLKFDQELEAKTIFSALLPRQELPAALALAQDLDLPVDLAFGKLSTGNQRKVLLVLAEYQYPADIPSTLLMDEPLSGVDAESRAYMIARWETSNPLQTRLISCHPEDDSMLIKSAVVIRDQKIRHHQYQSEPWVKVRKEFAL